MFGVFISYRSEDVPEAAHSLARVAKFRYGHQVAFLDKTEIRGGAEYPREIRRWIADKCTTMIVVIGPDWLSSKGGGGGRKIDARNDWVRQEVEQALDQELFILPVLVRGAPRLRKADLPEEIAALASKNPVPVREFDDDLHLDPIFLSIESGDPCIHADSTAEEAAQLPRWAEKAGRSMDAFASALTETIYRPRLGVWYFGLLESYGVLEIADRLPTMRPSQAAGWVEAMSPHDAARRLNSLRPRIRSQIIQELSPGVRAAIAAAMERSP